MALRNKGKSTATPPTFLTTAPGWGLDSMAGPIKRATRGLKQWYRTNNPSRKYEPRAHDWGFAAGALYKLGHGSEWNSFEYPKPEGLTNTLRTSWGINRRNDLLSSVYWLLTDGHRRDFQRDVAFAAGLDPQAYADFDAGLTERGASSELRWQLRQARINAYGVRGIDFAAWDLVRLIMLCTAGTYSGYITHDECLDAMALVQGELQARYPDWQSLGRDFAVARWFWSGGEDPLLVDTLAIINVLLSDGRPWQLVPYDMPQPPRDGAIVRALAESGVVVPLTEDERETADGWKLRIDDMIRSNGGTQAEAANAATLAATKLAPVEVDQPKRATKFGATVVDLRDGPYRNGPPSGEAGWLISLAAPYIESHALYHDGTSPIPGNDESWRAHLEAVWPPSSQITDWDAVLIPPTEPDGHPGFDPAQRDLADEAARADAVAKYAFIARVAVALGHIDEADALARIRTAATLIESRFSSWTEYAASLAMVIGNDKGPNNTVYRVVLSDLLDPGLPWGDVEWQSPSAAPGDAAS